MAAHRLPLNSKVDALASAVKIFFLLADFLLSAPSIHCTHVPLHLVHVPLHLFPYLGAPRAESVKEWQISAL
jgi:hypothetical protein